MKKRFIPFKNQQSNFIKHVGERKVYLDDINKQIKKNKVVIHSGSDKETYGHVRVNSVYRQDKVWGILVATKRDLDVVPSHVYVTWRHPDHIDRLRERAKGMADDADPTMVIRDHVTLLNFNDVEAE